MRLRVSVRTVPSRAVSQPLNRKIMNQILTMNRKLRRDARGVTAIEYGLLVALIIIACIVALSLTGTNAKKVFTTIGHGIENGMSTYPNGLPYQGLGIAPPSGTAVYDASTSSSDSSLPGYMVNGQLYSQVDPYGSKGFTVYADGFTATPSSTTELTFQSACMRIPMKSGRSAGWCPSCRPPREDRGGAEHSDDRAGSKPPCARRSSRR